MTDAAGAAAALNIATLGRALFPLDSLSTPRVKPDDDPGALSSHFDVTGLAAASMGLACAEIAALRPAAEAEDLVIGRRLASLWFGMTVRPRGWQLPPVWDSIAGVYRARDRWIRLHTNAPHHRAAALAVLACDAQREAVSDTVAGWEAVPLQEAVIAAGGCAAAMQSLQEWAVHPQGRAVAREPLIAWAQSHAPPRLLPPAAHAQPLAGIRVLDCTRVLAGPVCTRLLAGYGAQVLRIDPPGWEEANVEAEITPGKRLGTLDLRVPADLQRFEALLTQADVFVHGYRPGALDGLGLAAARRRSLNPGLIDVSLSAYGWSGPWAGRRGYDSLVQMSAGIAHEGMRRGNAQAPLPLPVQALDHATGYLMAAAAVRALRVAKASGGVLSARLSLARTAALLTESLSDEMPPALAKESDHDLAEAIEHTAWGAARRPSFPVLRGLAPPVWALPARPLHSDPPLWT